MTHISDHHTSGADLQDLLATLSGLGRSHDRVSVGDIREALGSRSFGPALTIPALIDISPIGSIFGLPTILAVLIALVAMQIAAGREHLWLPQMPEKRQIRGERLVTAMGWLRRGICIRLMALGCIALRVTVPPLEIIPLASTIPMAGVALVGLGTMARDGVAILAAVTVSPSDAGRASGRGRGYGGTGLNCAEGRMSGGTRGLSCGEWPA